MSHPPVCLLLVDEAGRLEPELAAAAAARGYRLTVARTLDEALLAARGDAFDVSVVDLDVESQGGREALRDLKDLSGDSEIVVVSDSGSPGAAFRSHELTAFAFVQKPVPPAQLFTIIERALERRRMTLHNRRLVWELQTINEIAEGISRSLELDTILSGALQCIVRAFNAAAGSIRLRSETSGLYEIRAYVGTTRAHLPWGEAHSTAGRPSDAATSNM